LSRSGAAGIVFAFDAALDITHPMNESCSWTGEDADRSLANEERHSLIMAIDRMSSEISPNATRPRVPADLRAPGTDLGFDAPRLTTGRAP